MKTYLLSEHRRSPAVRLHAGEDPTAAMERVFGRRPRKPATDVLAFVESITYERRAKVPCKVPKRPPAKRVQQLLREAKRRCLPVVDGKTFAESILR